MTPIPMCHPEPFILAPQRVSTPRKDLELKWTFLPPMHITGPSAFSSSTQHSDHCMFVTRCCLRHLPGHLFVGKGTARVVKHMTVQLRSCPSVPTRRHDFARSFQVFLSSTLHGVSHQGWGGAGMGGDWTAVIDLTLHSSTIPSSCFFSTFVRQHTRSPCAGLPRNWPCFFS